MKPVDYSFYTFPGSDRARFGSESRSSLYSLLDRYWRLAGGVFVFTLSIVMAGWATRQGLVTPYADLVVAGAVALAGIGSLIAGRVCSTEAMPLRSIVIFAAIGYAAAGLGASAAGAAACTMIQLFHEIGLVVAWAVLLSLAAGFLLGYRSVGLDHSPLFERLAVLRRCLPAITKRENGERSSEPVSPILP